MFFNYKLHIERNEILRLLNRMIEMIYLLIERNERNFTNLININEIFMDINDVEIAK